jgi:fatty-acid desaturase
MMEPVLRIDGTNASAVRGRPVLDVPKAAWNGGMLLIALVLGPLSFSWSALGLFIVVTYVSLLVGHSVGMHRMMIHRTFACSKPLERLLIYIGVLVGVAGPFGIIKIHDTRDWAQRQTGCHDFFAHTQSLPQDLLWQLAYQFEFDAPPKLTIEAHLRGDPWYRFLERTWRLHQLFPAVIFYLVGGWSWVIWGVCVRVIVSAAGHWTITYFCHNPGPRRWLVKDACVQASNLPGLGVLTYGECWHNNHHAFPESARIGLEPGQSDPGWMLISMMQRWGLARDVGVPRSLDRREDLSAVH